MLLCRRELLFGTAGLLTAAQTSAQEQNNRLPSSEPGYHIDCTPVRRIRATFADTIHLPKANMAEWVVLCGLPPDYGAQQDIRYSVSTSPLRSTMRVGSDDSAIRQRYLLISVIAQDGPSRQDVTVRVTFEATMHRRELKPGTASRQVSPLSSEVKRDCLKALSIYDFDSPAFGEWLVDFGLRRTKGESEFQFAGRVLNAMSQCMNYKSVPGADSRPSITCRRGWTHCGGMVGIFVAAMRANGIPARALAGRIVSLGTFDKTAVTTHARAEFHAGGIGWIPVEPTGYVVDKKNLDAYLGRCDGSFLTMCFDSLEIDHGFHGNQGPYPLINRCRGEGSPEGLSIDQWMKVEEIPIHNS